MPAKIKFYGADDADHRPASPDKADKPVNHDRGPDHVGPVITMSSLYKQKAPANGKPAGEKLWTLLPDGRGVLVKGCADLVTDEERSRLLTYAQLQAAREAMGK